MIERASDLTAPSVGPAPLPASDVSHAQLTAGQLLRAARESQGLHIDVVAAALKVPTQKLAALEADNIDALPDPVFARALAASVCRALRVDPAPVLEKLPGAPRTALAEADRSMGGSIRPQSFRSSSARSSIVGRPSRSLLAGVCALLVGALVLFFLPESATQQVTDAWARFTQGASPNSSTAADGTVIEPTQSAAPASPAWQTPAATVAPAAVQEAPSEAPGQAAQAAAAPVEPAVPSELLVFTASGEVWIRVVGAGGKNVFERTLKAGEVASVSPTELPVAVTVGRASAVQVRLRGEPFDLNSLARSGGVARFEVKP